MTRSLFENRPVRAPGLQNERFCLKSCRPRALTRRPGGVFKQAPWKHDFIFIPEGCLIIAQRFNVGCRAQNRLRPEGTAEITHISSAVPSGLMPAPCRHHDGAERSSSGRSAMFIATCAAWSTKLLRSGICSLALGFKSGSLGANVAFMPLLPELRRALRWVVTINMALLTELFVSRISNPPAPQNSQALLTTDNSLSFHYLRSFALSAVIKFP